MDAKGERAPLYPRHSTRGTDTVRTSAWFAAISASMKVWTFSGSIRESPGLVGGLVGSWAVWLQSDPGPDGSISIPCPNATRPLMRRASGEEWR